jgi:uncharacterized membrane protein
MGAMAIVGYVIIAVGIVLIVIGAVGAAFAVAETRPKGFAAPSTTLGAVLKALPEIIGAIAKSPPWLASIIVGCVLVWFGDQARIGGWPFA